MVHLDILWFPVHVMASPRSSRKVEQKVHFICEVENDSWRKYEIANVFVILPSILSTIMKNKQAKLDGFAKSFSMKRKDICDSKHPKVEAALVEWLKNSRGTNLPVSKPSLVAKAGRGAGLSDEQARFQVQQWLVERFKKQHGLLSKLVVGESRAVS